MKKLLMILLFAVLSVNAQQVLDKIAAVVDNEIILKSEVDGQAAYVAAQRRIDITDDLRKQVLNAMIEEKLLYAQAEIDSIIVTEEQVEQQLEYQLNYIVQQYGSKEKVEEVYGMGLEAIRRELREDVRKNAMAQMVQSKKFSNIQASPREVEEFFLRYRDSLGQVPEKYTIAHIFINPKAGERMKAKARDFARTLLDSIKAGADFALLAKRYSEDPGSAAQGGDLGFVKKGVFFPEFEAAAFALSKNQLSGIVETPVGFHIIQLLDRKGQSIHTRHILVKTKADDKSELETIEFLSAIRDSIIKKNNTFEYYAKKYSDDKETGPFNGLLGTFEMSQLDQGLKETVFKLKEGEISFPKRIQLDDNNYGYHLVYLLKRKPAHTANLTDDYDDLKKLAEYGKKQKLYKNWMEELKSKIYWENRL